MSGEFQAFDTCIDLEKDLTQRSALDIDNCLSVSATLVDEAPDYECVFSLLDLFLLWLDSLPKPICGSATLRII